MMLRERGWLVRYGVTVAVVGLAVPVQITLSPLLEMASPFLLFVVAVTASAVVAGLGPSLLAILLSAVVINYLFFDPYSFRIVSFGQLLNLLLFILEGALISTLIATMYSVRERSASNRVMALRNQESLRETEERYRMMIEGVRDYAIFMLDVEGCVVSWNEGARRIQGYEAREIKGEHFSRFYTPEDIEKGRPEQELGIAASEGRFEKETWRVRKDGSRFWASVIITALREGDSSLRGFSNVTRDITERRRTEEELRLRDRAISASPNGIVITDPGLPDNPIVYANPAFERITGYTPEEVLGRNCRFLQGAENYQPALEELKSALLEQRPCEVILRNYKKDGTPFWNELSVSPVFDDGGQLIRFVGVQDDVTDRRQSEDALRFLAESSETLASSLDYEATLTSVARLSVPRLADWCAVDVVEEDGTIQRLAVVHENPEKVELAHELQERYPPRPDVPYGLPHVLRTGQPEMVEEIPEAMLEENVRDEAHRVLLRELGLKSYMVVPLVARGRTLGAITLVMAESGRRYRESDLKLAKDLARRAALAVDNTRLYEEARTEISERRLAQEELRESEERYRVVTETASDAIVMIDKDSRIVFANSAVEKIFGYASEEVLGQRLTMLMPEHLRGVHEASLARYIATGERHLDWESIHLPGVRKSGETIPIEVSFGEFEKDGESFFTGFIRDITERLQAEEALRESEDRLRLSVEATALGTWEFNPVTGELQWDERTKALFGLPSDHELAYSTFLARLRPEDRAHTDEMVQRALDPSGDGMLDTEYRAISLQDGVERWLAARGQTFFEDGRAIRLIGTVLDITEEKRAEAAIRQSEERYRAVIEQTTEGIYLFDSETRRVLETNPSLQRMLVYTEEELHGMEIYDLMAHDREDVDENLKITLSERRRFVGERKYLRSDGTVVEVEAGVSVFRYDGHEVVCVTLHDITERKRNEQALQEIREAERNRIARDLHDGVLQDLSYTAQALQVTRVKSEGTNLESELEEQIDTILRSARGLREAIYDLRLQSYRDQDFDRLLESLVELTRRRSPDLRVELAVQEGFSEQLSRSAEMELLRIVQEALTNVRRHSGASSARISLGYSENGIWAEVSDDGWGFDQEAPPGTGILGMRERTMALGGRLEIRSEPGEGTTVRFESP